MKTQPYITPPGTYDLPFTWAFDASDFVDGTNHPNSSIYLQGGYGDFQLRRIIGMNRILAADGTGKFQVQRASKGSYIQSDPVQAPNSPELPITPEEPYLETGKIWFDLLGILKPATQPLTAQVAFQGVRRMKGNPPPQPSYRATPHSYTYQVSATLTNLASAKIPVVTKTLIVDYDFELFQIIILKSVAGVAAHFTYSGEAQAVTTFTAVTAGIGGNSITITVVSNNGVPNGVFSIAVVGNAITITSASSALGIPTTTGDQVVAAMTATPAAAALVTTTVQAGTGPLLFSTADFGPTNLSGGSGTGTGLAPITSPVCALYVYDQNKVKISNIPILDIFYDGGPRGIYKNGALVPPLFFRKDSILEIDFYSMITDASLLPADVTVYLVGKKLYPCA